MIKGLVTVLTPCHNGEGLIHRLLDSVLEQSYPHIHMIVVDDGSTDNSAGIIRSYQPRFARRGLSLTIISQKQGGVSLTINNGLKYVDGEFLVWPDVDDWYSSPLAIEKMVRRLKEHGPDVAVCRCAYNRVLEDFIDTIYRIDYPSMGSEPQRCFDAAIRGAANFWFEPGGWMIKTECIDEIIPGREIFHCRYAGQNAQILWPYLYYKKCVSIEEPLFTYLIRKSSHSRGLLKTYEKKIQQQEAYLNTFVTVIESIKDMTEEQKSKYISLRKAYSSKAKLGIAIKYKNKIGIKRYAKEMMAFRKQLSLSALDILKLEIRRYLLNPFKVLLYSFLILFAVIGVIFSYIFLAPKIARKYYEMTYSPIEYKTLDEFENKFKEATVNMLNIDVSSDESIIYYRTIDEYLHHAIHGSKLYSVFQYGEFGVMCHYMFKYAQNTGDKDLSTFVKHRIDTGLFDDGNFEIVRTDQCSYGCILIDLYKMFGDQKYKDAADKITQHLDSIYRVHGIIKYRENTDHQDVDAIGLVNPFLNLYATTFNNQRCAKLSSEMINEYCSQGGDLKTGLPCQAYFTKSFVKDLRANWGRGTGWYCLGLQSLPDSLKKQLTKQMEIKMDSTLLKLKPLYGQYLGGKLIDEAPDMSATVMILLYLIEKKAITMTKQEYVKLISPYVDKDGILRYNTPSIARPDEKPNAFQSHYMIQAMVLYTLSLL